MIERHLQTTPDIAGSLSPEWARPDDITKVFGIKRATLWALMKEGRIKSVSLRKRHQIRGTRLVNLESVREFIEAQLPGCDEEHQDREA
jgi:hypothetical protein